MNEFRGSITAAAPLLQGCLDPASRNPVIAVMVSRIDTQSTSVNRTSWTARGPVSRTYVLLRDREDEQRDAAAEECAGDDVREPVDLQVRATPGHADNTEAGERPPPSAVRASCREEQDECDTSRACVGGMARGERGAKGVDELIGRPGAIDQHLKERRQQRRQALGGGKRHESEPATSAKEEQFYEHERNGTTDPAPNPVEDECKIGE